MAKILHIIASPRGDRSASTTVAKEFLAAYQAKNAGDTVETLDLWKAELPPLDADTFNAKYALMSGQEFTPEQKLAWERVTKLADHFKSADKVVVSIPMWNFAIPYKLKHYIDLIVQPGLTFGYAPDKGYFGLVTGKKAVAIYASGGVYTPGSGAESYDQQSTYVRQILGFIGITDQTEIFVGGTAMNKDAVDAGKKQAVLVAATF